MDAQRLYTFEQEMNSLLTANIQGDDFSKNAFGHFYTVIGDFLDSLLLHNFFPHVHAPLPPSPPFLPDDAAADDDDDDDAAAVDDDIDGDDDDVMMIIVMS